MKDLRDELIRDKFDISKYDIIIGYRADDSYFSYIRDFLNNSIYIETLEKCMKIGDLGVQLCIKTPVA
jgi:predicted RNase H-like HicB family nuclease